MLHTPVLLNEVIKFLEPTPGKFIIDGTVNGGGHARVILSKIGKNGKLLAVDWDCEALKKFESNIGSQAPRVVTECANYADLRDILNRHRLSKADGLLLDLGFSSSQLDVGRGFSFQKNETLDMRYDLSRNLTAFDVVNKFNEKDLADIFWKFGEERYARSIAKGIVVARLHKSIRTTEHLVQIIGNSVPARYLRGRIHPATKVFQALRIRVNHELQNLEKILGELATLLDSGGRAVIISFHSLEDRMVKNAFRDLKQKKLAEILTKKPVMASGEEVGNNPRSRSAKLRAIKVI